LLLNQFRPQSTLLEPNWISGKQLKLFRIPTAISHWLLDRGSLTANLKKACKNEFRVRLVDQGWGRVLHSEGELLGMRRGEIAVLREVELLVDGVPWVFARTVIPASSLHGPTKRLTMLGTKPLGEVLFSDPRTHRVEMEIAALRPRHNLYKKATESLDIQPEQLWGRRTLFELSGTHLLVNELFLPSLGSV
jgi:chorismate--pyruvate lyase